MALIKCEECGKEISDKAKTCPNCGVPLNEIIQEAAESNAANNYYKGNISSMPYVGKKKSGCLKFFIIILFGCMLLSYISVITYEENGDGQQDEQKSKNNKDESIIINAEQFWRISPEQLIEIMGEPEEIEERDFDTGVDTYPSISYKYEDGRYNFLIIENCVVKLTVYSPKYKESNGEGFTYKSENQIFTMFGIKMSNDTVRTANTGYALRYQLVTDKIEDFWVTDIDSENKTFNIVNITYDQGYFGDLYLNTKEATNIQLRCEEAVKSVLKSPSTAKFPNIKKWYIARRREGIVAQSYVDSQNSFGAEIRSEFQFLINVNENGEYTVKSLIFDGVEMMR